MAELSDGRAVHVSRIQADGDLAGRIGDDQDDLKVKNHWRKPLETKIGKKRDEVQPD